MQTCDVEYNYWVRPEEGGITLIVYPNFMMGSPTRGVTAARLRKILARRSMGVASWWDAP